jgi:lipoyl(octanoyl) transferase
MFRDPLSLFGRKERLMKECIHWLDLGLIGYDEAFSLQRRLHEGCWKGTHGDAVLFQENPPVITLGRSGREEHLLWTPERLEAAGIEVREVGRGGDVTYHGPGQIVISPILHFRRYVSTALDYLRALEETVIRLLAGYGLAAGRIEGKTGVWAGGLKVAAAGVAVSHGVTMHGLAVNIRPDMEHFSAIVPCGLRGMGVTSLKLLGRGDLSYARVRDDWLAAFESVFGLSAVEWDPKTAPAGTYTPSGKG